MSSDVQAKWMNSDTRATSGASAKRSLSQYSTALTSWFVLRSIALTRAASSGEKPVAASSSSFSVRRGEGRNFGHRRLGGERRQPRDLDAHPMPDEPEFAELLAQRRHLGRIATVERRQRGEGGEFGGGHSRDLSMRRRGDRCRATRRPRAAML